MTVTRGFNDKFRIFFFFFFSNYHPEIITITNVTFSNTVAVRCEKILKSTVPSDIYPFFF